MRYQWYKCFFFFFFYKGESSATGHNRKINLYTIIFGKSDIKNEAVNHISKVDYASQYLTWMSMGERLHLLDH